MAISYQTRGPVDDEVLTRLHERAFARESGPVIPWATRLEHHSLSWITAAHEGHLVGFVNVVGDGGAHAFILDAIVDPTRQARGIGSELIRQGGVAAAHVGCQWLHVDYEPELAGFYEHVCGFRPTAAGLLRLD